jgi:hypothetical protein
MALNRRRRGNERRGKIMKIERKQAGHWHITRREERDIGVVVVGFKVRFVLYAFTVGASICASDSLSISLLINAKQSKINDVLM